MIDLEQLQILAQLVDNAEILVERIEKSFSDNNSETYNINKKEILDIQKKISDIIK